MAQTAHDQGYIVKHLLAGLPQVTERVKAMRQGRNGNMADDAKDRMFASQEAYIKVRTSLLGQYLASHPIGHLWNQGSAVLGVFHWRCLLMPAGVGCEW